MAWALKLPTPSQETMAHRFYAARTGFRIWNMIGKARSGVRGWIGLALADGSYAMMRAALDYQRDNPYGKRRQIS